MLILKTGVIERIIIEVEDATAEKWRAVSPKIKTQLEKNFETQIEILSHLNAVDFIEGF